MRKFQVLQVAITKLQQLKWSGTVSCSLSKCLETPNAHDWRKDVSSQTTVECWRRDRQRTRALVGRKRWLHHSESPTLTAMRTCFQRVCEQHSWNGAIDLTKERGLHNLYVQVAGVDGSIEQAVDVSPNEMEVDESGHRASGGLRQVNP